MFTAFHKPPLYPLPLVIFASDPNERVLLSNWDLSELFVDSMSKNTNVCPTVATASPFSSIRALITSSHPLVLYATGVTETFFRNRICRKFTRNRNKLSKFVYTPFLSASRFINWNGNSPLPNDALNKKPSINACAAVTSLILKIQSPFTSPVSRVREHKTQGGLAQGEDRLSFLFRRNKLGAGGTVAGLDSRRRREPDTTTDTDPATKLRGVDAPMVVPLASARLLTVPLNVSIELAAEARILNTMVAITASVPMIGLLTPPKSTCPGGSLRVAINVPPFQFDPWLPLTTATLLASYNMVKSTAPAPRPPVFTRTITDMAANGLAGFKGNPEMAPRSTSPKPGPRLAKNDTEVVTDLLETPVAVSVSAR